MPYPHIYPHIYAGPSREQIAAKQAELEKEIAWNRRRLDELVLDEEDRAITVDYLADLEAELGSLMFAFYGISL
jgi:hypothetical protein